MEGMGYSNYWAKVNAKDHGIPQNRERVLMVSALGGFGYRFPPKRPLGRRLMGFLEPDPPAKYDLSPRILSTMLFGESKGFDRRGDFEDSVRAGTRGVARTIKAKGSFDSGWTVLIHNATKRGFLEAAEGDGLDCSSRMASHRGTVQSGMAQTIKTQADVGTAFGGRLRKLTPLECMRLMGFGDGDFRAMREIGMSDSAIYHCAGDSIVVDVLMDVFRGMIG